MDVKEIKNPQERRPGFNGENIIKKTIDNRIINIYYFSSQEGLSLREAFQSRRRHFEKIAFLE